MKELIYLKKLLEDHELTFQEIIQMLEWTPKKRKLYKQILSSWEDEGEIYLKRNGKYTLPENDFWMWSEKTAFLFPATI